MTNNEADNLFDKLDKKLADLYLVASGGKQPSDTITAEQRKKVYAMIHRLGAHLGYNTDDMKGVLKSQFCEKMKCKSFSLSDCTKATAHDFIDYCLLEMIEHGMEFTPEDIMFYEKTVRFVMKMVQKKKCIVCGKDARESRFNHRPFTLCEVHIPEWSKDKKAFIEKYHFSEYFFGLKQ